MTPIPMGYFPKRTSKKPDWLQTPRVVEICSVSDCVSKPPTGWINRWLHNALWVFDSPTIAWDVVPVDQWSEFDLYAYRLFPVEYESGEQNAFEIPRLIVVPISDSFEFLGFDAVSRSLGTHFECSPLSCNGAASDHEVNKYCLVNDSDSAFRLAREFSEGGSGTEPGPYYVAEVFRERKRN